MPSGFDAVQASGMGLVSNPRECPGCTKVIRRRRFDLNVRVGEGERQYFGLPARFCSRCRRLWLDDEAARLYGIDESDIIYAIESDQYMRMRLGFEPG